jgi:stage IV sporulation protein FB
MFSIVDCPDSSRGEWRFRLGDIPVRVLPWFWISMLFFGYTEDVGALMIWVAVCFVSILLHELGHVIAFRLFGARAEIALYAWGGLAIPDRDYSRRTSAYVTICVAGPLAGFCLAALAVGAALASGTQPHFGFVHHVIPTVSAWPASEFLESSAVYYRFIAINDLLWINFYWGLMNLLPVYPLDGGQASRALFERADPVRGRRRSLRLSMLVAAAIALSALLDHNTYLVWMFGLLAAGSAQLLESNKPMFRPGTYRWR